MNAKPTIFAALAALLIAFAMPADGNAQSRRNGPSVHPVHVQPTRPIHVVSTPAPRLDLRQDLAQTQRTVERAASAAARIRSRNIQTQIALAQQSLAEAQRLLARSGSVRDFEAAIADANQHARTAQRQIDQLVVVHNPHRH